jgi:Xaa-Pro aminopeptidase
VLQDLVAISQVQEALEESEDGESDYMEVMEYLRVAPLLLFSELAAGRARAQAIAALINRGSLPMSHIPKAEYARRRKALMAQMVPNSIAILPAAAVAIRNRDVEHVYRQDSDFQYLSGFPEPEAVIALIPAASMASTCCSAVNATRARAVGRPARRPGRRDARFRRRRCLPITDIDEILPGLIEGRERVFGHGQQPEFDRRLMDWINVIRSKARLGAQPPNEFVALDHLLHDMRLYKSAAEVKVMRAARHSARAHGAMQARRPGCTNTAWKPSWTTSSARARRCRPTARSSRPGATAASCITSRTTRRSRTATWC